MNLWRGVSTKGEPFTSFNLLLLDNKRCRVHAFVPGSVAASLEPILEIGKIYLFNNFTAKDYKADEKFRPVHKTWQIVLGQETKITSLDENEVAIDKAAFDFYDLADLKDLANQSTYLTDVIGVVHEREIQLGDIKNRFGVQQRQIKITITDGRRMVKVTFWDDFAQLFADAVKKNTFEYPLILIVCCGRAQEWQKQINITNVTATTFYINCNHSSVAHMRKMLSQPEFEEYNKSVPKWKPIQMLSINQIKNVKADDSETEVLCKVIIDKVMQDTWYKDICTSCYSKLQVVGYEMNCLTCPRTVPYADKWFEIYCIASDATGSIPIMLDNFSAMKCFGKRAYDVYNKGNEVFPDIIKSLEKKLYTVKIMITIHNITGRNKVYTVKDMVPGHILKTEASESEDTTPKPVQESFAEPSSSSYHLDSVSENI
uniref:Replication factor A C-terminal domain-containing protein n=1 Tax=Daucus carota subsp. sativus TaxID=79200 RepID=A0A166I8N2_DAUCS